MMKKVLIAEDESAIREIIAITLQRAGYEVTEACDGEQALLTYTERIPTYYYYIYAVNYNFLLFKNGYCGLKYS